MCPDHADKHILNPTIALVLGVIFLAPGLAGGLQSGWRARPLAAGGASPMMGAWDTAIQCMRPDVPASHRGTFGPEAQAEGRSRCGDDENRSLPMNARLLPLYATFVAAHIALIAVVIALG
jgi:hypothetical protein